MLLLMPMNKKSTSETIIREKKESLSPKESTICFLMNFARAYSCDSKSMSTLGGYILN